MSTYHGQEFLRPQVDSILSQDHRDIRLIVRDDGSTDATNTILNEYAERDDRITVITDDLGNLGAFASFMRLVEVSDAPYFMFADQDDVWLPEKISKMLAKMTELTDRHGSDNAIVVFSDLSIADEDLNLVDRSLWHYQQFDPNISGDWKHLLAQNVVLGCAMIANAGAREISLPYRLPDMPHDQWVAVNTAKYGQIAFISEPTILYRQHEQNHSGANSFRLKYALSRLPNFVRTIGEYRQAVKVFGGVTTMELILNKVRLNMRRFRKRDDF